MKVIVIGGGAAGMIAAITSAKSGNEVILLEKTSSLGNKLKITGKGRCNLTFNGNMEDFKNNIVKNYKFMYSSFSNFDNNDVIQYFNSLGVKTKIERGNRIFPESDNALEIVNVLKKELKKYNVRIEYNSNVENIIVNNGRVNGVISNGRIINCDKCIVATGGKSYTTTGSTGDGYKLAKKIGHSIVDIRPALVPLRINNIMCKRLQGLSLKNVALKIIDNNSKVIYQDFGELMFTHFGITGPIVLSASSSLNLISDIDRKIKDGKIYAIIDFKPALDFDILDKRVCRDFEKYSNKEFKNSLNELLPQKLIPVIIELSNISPDKKVHQITKLERQNLVKLLKEFKLQISGTMPIDIAIITSGGVDVKEVNPKTMESKIINGLYFAGEILDVDAYTGGYNLQIAFSTGYVAGM